MHGQSGVEGFRAKGSGSYGYEASKGVHSGKIELEFDIYRGFKGIQCRAALTITNIIFRSL